MAQTALVVPFHWGDAGRAPGERSRLARYLLMDKLLQRFVLHPETGQREFLWEMNRTIPFEIGTATLSGACACAMERVRVRCCGQALTIAGEQASSRRI